MARIRERRRRRRIDVALPITIKYDHKKISSHTKNISILGVYLEAENQIPIGTVLNIKIVIPKTAKAKTTKAKEIKCMGITFRSQALGILESKQCYGIGVFFRSFLEGGERELSKYIDYILLEEEKEGKIFIRKRKRKTAKQKGGKR